MLILTNAGTDKLQLVTDSGADVDVHATWIDRHTSTFEQTLGRTNTAITTAATTDIVATPGSSTVRVVKTLHARNKDASVSQTVTVVYDQNGTDFELHKVTLLPGEALEYIEGIGFFTLEAADVASPVQVLRLGSNDATSSTTAHEVTGLTAATGTGTYIFEYYLLLQSGATTTGHKFDVNYDGTASSLSFFIRWLTAATTASDDVPDQDHTAAPGGVMSGFSARSGGTGGTGQTTDVDATNSDVLYIIEGIMVVTVAGNLELWYGSEAAAASTMMAGSSLRLTKTA